MLLHTDYVVKDLTSIDYNKNPSQKKASYIGGTVMILLIAFQIFGYLKYNKYMDSRLVNEGVETTGTFQEIYWHASSKKRTTGYKLEYFYEIRGIKYHHKTLLQDSLDISIIKIKYLPNMPNKHTIEIK